MLLLLLLQLLVSGYVQPSTYALLLTSANGLYYYDDRLIYANVNTETERVIILETNFTLPIKTLWDVVVLAYGCRENPITSGQELSKEITYSYLVMHCHKNITFYTQALTMYRRQYLPLLQEELIFLGLLLSDPQQQEFQRLFML